MFPWEPACQSSSLDSPVIEIKCERINGYIASHGRAKKLSGCILYPKYASLCEEEVFSQLFQMDCCSFGLLLLAVLCLRTQNLELTVKEPPVAQQLSYYVLVQVMHNTCSPGPLALLSWLPVRLYRACLLYHTP